MESQSPQERPKRIRVMVVALKPRLTTRNMFMLIVVVMWVTSFIADLLNKAYEPPAYVNPLILLVGGYLFATADKAKDKPPKEEVSIEKEKT